MVSRKYIKTTILEYLNEQVSNELIRDMKAFGLSRGNIDSEGYVTLYHGGVELPERLKEDEIFFMSSSYDGALDYAKMRKGEVFEIKVKPEDVNWNQGSYEVEFDKGGLIRDGKIISKIKEKTFSVNPFNEIKNSYSGYMKISDEIFKWIERTLNYYISSKKMTPNESYKQLIDDIDFYYMMDEEDVEFVEFAEMLDYSVVDNLSSDLSDLNTIEFNEVFYES